MSIIICHNWYRKTMPSGENIVVARELALLKAAKITTHPYMFYNDEMSLVTKMLVTLRTLSSKKSHRYHYQKLRTVTSGTIFHAHNVIPSCSYEIFRVAKELGWHTIHTLHNYLALANRATEPRLIPQNAWYKTFLHRALWENLQYIDTIICLTELQKNLFIKYGLPANKVVVKPNFVFDRNLIQPNLGNYAIFVGRLTPEKGILQLVNIFRKLTMPLYVVGSGPLKLPEANNIHYVPQMPHAQVMELIAGARFLINNSCCFESFGLTLIEALSCGIPCLVPNIGATAEIIHDGTLGYHFKANDPCDLANQACKLWENARSMREACRLEYLSKYTPAQNLPQLLTIYEDTDLRN